MSREKQTFTKRADGWRQKQAANRRKNRNAQLARFATTRRLRKLRSALNVGKNLPRLLQKTFTSGRQGQLLFAPNEQLRPKFVFQIVNLTAERRLRYVQAFCGLTDVQSIGDSHKVS